MSKRITVSKMISQLEKLEKKGFGDYYICVNEYYIDDEYNMDEALSNNELWKEISYDGIHVSDVPLTKEQEEYVNNENKKYMDSLPKKRIF